MFFNQDPFIKHGCEILGDESDQNHYDLIDIILES